jgi:hypothetical protein
MTFASQLQAAFTPIAATYDTPSITRALSWAQSFIEGYCNRESFDVVTAQQDYLTPMPYRQALIPHYPVLNIESVQGLMPPHTATQTGLQWTPIVNYAWVPDTGLLYDTTGEPGVSHGLGPTWPRTGLPGSLWITYDYGYATVPQGLVDVGCRAAQQYLENPTLQMGRKVGDLEDRFYPTSVASRQSTGGGFAGPILPDHDRKILGRYVDISIA